MMIKRMNNRFFRRNVFLGAAIAIAMVLNSIGAGWAQTTLVKDSIEPTVDIVTGISVAADNSYTTIFDPDYSDSGKAGADRGQSFTLPEIAGIKNAWEVSEITVAFDDSGGSKNFTTLPNAKFKLWVFEWNGLDANDRSSWVGNTGTADGNPFDGTGISNFLVTGDEVAANLLYQSGDFLHFRFSQALLLRENTAYGFLISYDDNSASGTDIRIQVHRETGGGAYPDGFCLIVQPNGVNSSNELKDELIFYIRGTESDTILDIEPDDDTDGDLLPDLDEINIHGTDPEKFDSDDDGTPDGMEISKNLNPNDPASRLDRPNIIFILCDDLGYGDLGVLFQNSKSGKKHLTPKLDQMAAEGMILANHYCPAPVCAPSRGSLLTGKHQGHANVRDNQFDKALENNHNLATTLKAAGYSTALIGKYGLQGSGGSPAAWPAYPTKRGFDYFMGYVRHGDGHQHYPANSWPLGNSSGHRSPKELYENDNEISGTLDKCYTADLFTARAKKLIIDQTAGNPNKPFFIYLAYDTPHAALQVPTVAYPAGSGVSGGLQWNGISGNMINTATGTIDSYYHPDYAGKGWANKEERFATSVRRIDDCIGDLIQTLKDLNIDNNTLIVFSSDNGPHSESYISGVDYNPTSFQSYGNFDGIKRDTWEGGIRMPTLAWWPGKIGAGQVNTRPSQFHDWLATFVDLSGWEIPSYSDGVSLVPNLTGNGVQKEGLVYIEYYNSGSTPTYSDFDPSHRGRSRKQMQVIHLEGYKGVRYNITSHANHFEIYDLAADPQELTNLAGSSSYFNGLQQRMKDKVLRVRQVDGSASRPYDGELVPPITVTVEPGIRYRAYEGLWPWLPEFRWLLPEDLGQAADFDVSKLTRTDHAGLLFTGYIQIPADGQWNFYITSDTGTSLRIHDSDVIDDDYNHTGLEAQGAIQLKAGLHPFRLYYRSSIDLPALSVQWSGPSVAKQNIPASALFRRLYAPGDLSEDGNVNMDDIDMLSDGWKAVYNMIDLVDIAHDWLR